MVQRLQVLPVKLELHTHWPSDEHDTPIDPGEEQPQAVGDGRRIVRGGFNARKKIFGGHHTDTIRPHKIGRRRAVVAFRIQKIALASTASGAIASTSTSIPNTTMTS